MRKMERMKIIVTNDDGIFAPGIECLAAALSEFADVTVIAPDKNRSGVSSKITLEVPIRVFERSPGWYQVTGTPADCIKLALSGFISEEADMVVSGINHGANLGDDVIYSGTVAAAIEGRFFKMPSLAVSCVGKGDLHYETAAKVACDVVKQLQHKPLDERLILNLNVPNIPLSELQGGAGDTPRRKRFRRTLKADGRCTRSNSLLAG